MKVSHQASWLFILASNCNSFTILECEQSHPVKSLELEDNLASETGSRTSPLKDVCLGLTF